MEDKKEAFVSKGVTEWLTLGIIKILEKMPWVMDVRFAERDPAEKETLLSWEQKNSCILPEDLRTFYLTIDGFTLTWSVKMDDKCVPLGCMLINSVNGLCPLTLQTTPVSSLDPDAPSLADLDWEEDSSENGLEPKLSMPHFDARSRIYELNSCSGNGRVCLVYKNCTPGVVAQQSEIWFLDRSLYWHFLTEKFTAYYRMMITHLGLPEWQYNYTPYGPSPQAKQWAALYKPLIFSEKDSAGDVLLNTFDPTKVFKGKTKVSPTKKKQATPCSSGPPAKGQGNTGRPSGAKR
ncbi:tubulin polyglutamylase complex subunit 2 [Cyprinodon tularosa]|uniref:tubulin polyglutamylase complex subunit 2 n=1 Tax=Cyprinodon tularosa TaxID=77115 RepID=UPI0018E290EA|nr:tubulin polyglutamylase complex subunit 2 [Cyprinodon tularosa]